MKRVITLAGALALASSAALAQIGSAPVYQSWFQIGTPITGWTVSGTSSNQPLPTGGNVERVCNQGSVDAYIALGTSNAVTATTNGTWVQNGTCISVSINPYGNASTQYTYIAGITASGSTTVRVEAGVGSPDAQQSTGAVGATVNQGTPNAGVASSWPFVDGGAAGTGITPPTGGTYDIGFLSGIYNDLQTMLATTVQAVSLQACASCTQVQGSASGANAIETASLPAVSGKTNFVCSVTFTADGATAGLAVAPTITGLLGGAATYSFNFPTGALIGAQPLVLNFNPCFPASATNTAISAALPAGGSGNTQASANIYGYYK